MWKVVLHYYHYGLPSFVIISEASLFVKCAAKIETACVRVKFREKPGGVFRTLKSGLVVKVAYCVAAC